jgi:hypothetical protein
MDHRDILLILLQPFGDIVTEWFNVKKFWRVVIIERKMNNTSIKFGWVVNALGAQIVDFKMILMLFIKEPFDIVHRISV